MTKTLQLLRGTTAQNDSFTGHAGELTVDTTTNELRLHDGSTAGGHTIPNKAECQGLLGGGTAGTLLTNSGTPGTVNATSIDVAPTDGSGNPVSSDGVYDALATKADTATTLSGYGITDGANTDLSNLTSTGKSKLGATVYGANGLIFNCGTDPVIGTGHADVYLYQNGLAVIEFCLEITTAGVSSSEFLFGLNRDALHNANNNIPLITPVSGVCTYFDAGTGVVSGLTGYAGVLQGGLQFWRPCRVCDTLGNVGGWPTSSFPVGTRIVGTVYGTYTV